MTKVEITLHVVSVNSPTLLYCDSFLRAIVPINRRPISLIVESTKYNVATLLSLTKAKRDDRMFDVI